MIDFATVITRRVQLSLSKLEASNVEATSAEVCQVLSKPWRLARAHLCS